MKPQYLLKNLNAPVFLSLTAMHILAVIALFHWNSAAFWSSFWVGAFTLSLGVGVCNHRLLTHKSFKTPKWFRYELISISNMNSQGGPLFWVGKHLWHHALSDKLGDPHSPEDGFDWAHMFWLIFKTEDGHDPLVKVRDLIGDRKLVSQDRYSWVPQALLTVLFFLIGYMRGEVAEGLTWVLWGIGMRVTIIYHITWCINSIGHKYGYQTYATDDQSRNVWWLALFSFGESWHNNHHHDPRAASHGMKWYEIDLSYWIIVVLSWFGLAYDIIKPKAWREPRMA